MIEYILTDLVHSDLLGQPWKTNTVVHVDAIWEYSFT